nr:hypothetical protein [Tanacetum cinerariifolium]GEY67432.1 hypothetical protein [Tanacetum cinerariifolium]
MPDFEYYEIKLLGMNPGKTAPGGPDRQHNSVNLRRVALGLDSGFNGGFECCSSGCDGGSGGGEESKGTNESNLATVSKEDESGSVVEGGTENDTFIYLHILCSNPLHLHNHNHYPTTTTITTTSHRPLS